MRWRKIGTAAFIFSSLLLSSCEKTPVDSSAKPNPNQSSETLTDDNSKQPPFATKEPEKYSAKIVFAFRYDEAAANFIEQTYFVARDGANRRLDFESGERDFSHLQTADGKQFILLTKQKVYAELNATKDNLDEKPGAKTDLKNITNQSEDFSLERLLYTKPVGATFRRVGEEEILGRKTIKYNVAFETVQEGEKIRTETFVWADETLGLPIKTEVVAMENGSPSGAKNIIELREIKMEVDAKVFEIPKDFR
ncbi:MAG: hypothetical protein ABI954_08235, partial [Pyrinomonadaceae bacterium]